MKAITHILAACFVGSVLIAGCLWFLDRAQAARPVSVPRVLPAHSIEGKPILLDDFTNGNWRNNLGGDTGCASSDLGWISCTLQIVGNDGFLEMQYDVDVITPATYAWYYSELNNLNMTVLDTVWVAVKGEEGGEPIFLEFKDCGPHYPKELVSKYLTQGIITSEWSAVAVPLVAFSDEITDWTCIEKFNIIASNQITSGQGKIYVDEIRFLPAQVLVDDFHDSERENELGGYSGRWDGGGVITYVYASGALKLSYDVQPGDVGVGYWTKLRYTNLLSQKDYLLFDIRGKQGAEEILVEVKDCGLSGDAYNPRIKVSDYIKGGITTSWNTVAIPLAAFVDEQYPHDAGIDWTCIDQLTFTISGQAPLNGGQGTVYIDNIKLAPPEDHPVPVLVDHLQDCDDWNGLLKRWNFGSDGTGSFSAGPDSGNNHEGNGCGYRFTFNLKDTDSGYAWTELRGLDVTDYTHLEFYIKGKKSSEDSDLTTHVYLRDRSERQRYASVTPSADWQRVLIPLTYYSDAVDLTDLSEVKFAFERAFLSGEVYIDDISFTTIESYLPIVFKDYRGDVCSDSVPSCSSPYNNYEPNNYRCSTTFELSSGVPIQSYICSPDDKDDYYYINVATLTPINVQLTGLPHGVDYDLYLYFDDSIVANSANYGNVGEALTYAPSQTGMYFIRVYPYSGHSLSPYTLQADFQ
jgi:hypothetical protein